MCTRLAQRAGVVKNPARAFIARGHCAKNGAEVLLSFAAFNRLEHFSLIFPMSLRRSVYSGARAFFSEIAQGTSAKTVCTIRQARSDAVQVAENALDRQANGARILTNQIRAAQHLLALIREQFKL